MGHEHMLEANGKEANAALKWVHILVSNSKALLIGKKVPVHEARFTAEREFIYLPAEDEEDWNDREDE